MIPNSAIEFEKPNKPAERAYPLAHPQVTRVEFRAGLSELFELVVDVADSDPNAKLAELVGLRAWLSLPDEPFAPRLEGLIRRVRQLAVATPGGFQYELTLVPPCWLLTRKRDNRIFRDLTVVEIANEVAKGYGDRVGEPKQLLKEKYEKREYCVQYDETDFDFVVRILAEEGITFFFDHATGGAWTLTDDVSKYGKRVADDPIHLRNTHDRQFGPHVTAVTFSTDLETSAMRLRTWDYAQPQVMFDASVDGPHEPLFSREGDLRDHIYEVGYGANADEQRERATRYLEEARAMRRVVTLSTSFAAYPGQKLTIDGHPRDEINGELVVVQTAFERALRASAYRLVCIGANTQYRPPRKSKTRIFGTQTALVVTNNEKEEIWVDELGRVKLLFRWDERKREHETVGDTTRWVRVSHGWAGQNYGLTMLPRRGDEVIVSYLEGDPDEPIIVGRVHNPVRPQPLDLPADRTQSIWRSRSSPPPEKGAAGYNEIMMEDRAGAELLRVRAERDYTHHTNHDSATSVGHNQTINVRGAQSTSAGSISTHSGSNIVISAEKAVSTTAGTSVTTRATETIKEDAATIEMQAKKNIQLVAEQEEVHVRAPMVKVEGNAIINKAESTYIAFADDVSWISGGSAAWLTSKRAYVSGTERVEVDAPAIKIDGQNVTISGATKITILGGDITIAGGNVKVHGEAKVAVDAPVIKLNCGDS